MREEDVPVFREAFARLDGGPARFSWDADAPLQHETTQPPGTVITRWIGGHACRFELTDAPLGNGTYSAKPLD
ncbi:hypothetical protein ACFVY0_42485 [Streptomyces sp. NPDC058286]|uniref:hypothetical protein n=1 Tax=Streptomyces sp. NPDC058286 TaxID=3346422 RepID=UPI0036E9B744